MIQIVKPNAPDELIEKGNEEVTLLIAAFLSDRAGYLDGSKKFEIKSSVYGNKKVKKALWDAQHGKCVFCELVKELQEGHVEHFRGKAGYVQNEGDALGRPGYYWLAYTWDNLFFSCFTCNSVYKKNFFPLVDPGKRARTHEDDIAAEEPLFIHPSAEKPENYLEFISWNIRAIDGNDRGNAMINFIGLNRGFHIEERMKVYLGLKKLWEIAQSTALSAEHKTEILELISSHTRKESTYSLMANCAVRDAFIY